MLTNDISNTVSKSWAVGTVAPNTDRIPDIMCVILSIPIH